MLKNLSLSITACTNWGITHYERERGRSYINIDGDHGQPVDGASGSELDLRGGEDLRVVKTSER